jgi:hypothetical protein
VGENTKHAPVEARFGWLWQIALGIALERRPA